MKEELKRILEEHEHEHVERKAAEKSYSYEDLLKYVSAISNEGGGWLILGQSNDLKITGTTAFRKPEKLKIDVLQNAKMSRKIRIDIEIEFVDDHRIVFIKIPPRPRGEPISVGGAYWMRSGESLVAMDSTTLKGIFEEHEDDFSAAVCPDMKLIDLDSEAINKLRELWAKKSGQENIKTLSNDQLLSDLGLIRDGKITYAAIVLLGSEKALNLYLANAEIVWEFRKNLESIEFQNRVNYKVGFLTYFDDLWAQIDAHNEKYHLQEGFIVNDVKAFNEEVIRESVLNAVSHRDYRDPSSVYIRQTSANVEIESPGGFPTGITIQNIIHAQSKPRNRLIAETLEKTGFVDRSGQGVDKIFKNTIVEGKGLPDYGKSTDHLVKLTIAASIKDPEFIRYIQRANIAAIPLSISDLVLLEKIRAGTKVGASDGNIGKLLEANLIEPYGRGRGYKYILSKQYYTATDKRGEYTRIKGLDKGTNKQLILTHLQHHKKGYAADFMAALKNVKRPTLNQYLKELQNEGQIELVGNRRIGRGDKMAYWRLTIKETNKK
jgi:ATP-dependent DNA helicase RecG